MSTAWLGLLRDLFLFRRGPADVPHAPTLVAVLVAAMIALDVLSQRLLYTTPGPIEGPFVNMLIGLLMLHVVLQLHGKQARFVQTATVWILCRLAVTLASAIIMWFGAPLPLQSEEVRPEHLVLVCMTLPLLIWYVALRVQVLRQALDVTLSRAFIVFLLMGFAQYVMLVALLEGKP